MERSLKKKINALIAHNIEYTIQDGRLMAVEIFCLDGRAVAEWVDITDVNVYHWLGY